MRIGVFFYPKNHILRARSGFRNFRQFMENQIQQTIPYLVENKIGVYVFPNLMLSPISDPHNPTRWNTIEENADVVKAWGNALNAANIRLIVSMPSRIFDTRVKMYQKFYFNTGSKYAFHQVVAFWIQGAVELLETAGMKEDSKIIITNCKRLPPKYVHYRSPYYKSRAYEKNLFLNRFYSFDEQIRSRLVIENMMHVFNLKNCLELSRYCGIPVVFHTMHHDRKINQEPVNFNLIRKSWGKIKPLAILSSPEIPLRVNGGRTERLNIPDLYGKYPELFSGEFDLLIDAHDGIEDIPAVRSLISR